MTPPPRPRLRLALRWVAAIMFVLTSAVFVSQQAQQPGASYKRPPAPQFYDSDTSDAFRQPAYRDLLPEYGYDDPIVRLPGPVATFDESAVLPLLETTRVHRIVLTPPRGAKTTEMQVPSDVMLVTGTHVEFLYYSHYSTNMSELRAMFEYGDVTSPVLRIIAETIDDEALQAQIADYTFTPRTREPTAEEAAAVVADLQDDGMAFLGGATPFARPATNPFFSEPLFIVAPTTAPGESSVDYRDAVAAAFPDRAIVAMRGFWIEFFAAETAEIAPVVTAIFYGHFQGFLATFAIRQEKVVTIMLGQIEASRDSGMFDDEIPYVPADPLHIALPWLPWLAGGFAVVTVATSLRSRRKDDGTTLVESSHRIEPDLINRLARLANLSVVMSSVALGDAKPRFAQATADLSIARDGLERGDIPADELSEILDRVEADLAEVSAKNHLDTLKPDVYLRSGFDQ